MLPDAMGKLIHLRYFGFKSSSIVEFPSSIRHWRSLIALVATGNSPCKLPTDIAKLHQLRHLIACPHGNLHVSALTSLQTLRYVNYRQWVEIDAANLINLRELEIREIPYADMKSIWQLKRLQSLTLQTKTSFVNLHLLSQCQHLIKLKLEGKIDDLPGNRDEFPPNLTILILYGSALKEDPMPILEHLPSLSILDMGKNSFLGYKMVFSETGFSQLQVLRISWLWLLETLEVESGAMPRLKHFSVEDCKNLTTVPERLRMLPLPQEW
ncbi:putative disease resistance RPP13-like protein 2 [Pistacia vera]|nr:putative disease resistance RPP13-like protein 2 [Pistacia vera]